MNRSQAAIASRAAGELYGLSVMAENICYNDQNVTRFIIVSAHPVYEKSAAKVSVCFRTSTRKQELCIICFLILFTTD